MRRRSVTTTRPVFAPRVDRLYIAFNKPYGVLSQFTTTDSDKQTMRDFAFPPRVYPIGRLDYDSEGLILLSDDAALNDALLNPKQGHSRTYLAQVENVPDEEALRHLRDGVTIQGHRTLPALASLLPDEPNLPPRSVPIRYRAAIPTAWLRLTLTEGRNRQVRRMTAAVGHPTLRLVRVAIGQLDLFRLHLAPGEWRNLSHADLLQTFRQPGSP